MSNSWASIGLQWNVNSSYHDHDELSREINGPAFNSHILQVCGSVTVYSHCVSAPLVTDVHTEPPTPLLLLDSLVLSWRCMVKAAWSMAESGMNEWSQVSVINRMQLSLTALLVAICSLSSSILLVRNLVFVRKRLGNDLSSKFTVGFSLFRKKDERRKKTNIHFTSFLNIVT